MADVAQESTAFHGGRLIARRLKTHGVERIFTLSGGHLFSLYDGCREEGVELVDTRHEATAAFAAEGTSKVTRQPGVCALTAGPGVTNGMSAMASAQANHSPMLVLAGRAPAMRWGQGSLQEIDHVPFVRPLAKFALTADSAGEMQGLIDEALLAAAAPHGGVSFIDLPLDHVFSEAEEQESGPPEPDAPRGARSGDIERAAELLSQAERPVIMAGSDLYWGHGETALRELVHELGIPAFQNGMARGCIPADDPFAFSRSRSFALGGADVALIVGVPLDFRLAFGAVFPQDAKLIVVDSAEPQRSHPRQPEVECYGDIGLTIEELREATVRRVDTSAWVAELRAQEESRRAGEQAELSDSRAPLHPMRIYGELASMLDRNAIVVGDGGDFVSYAGRLIDSYEPGCWVDPGPFGCLGSGPGYALAAKLAHPDRQVVLLLGDGAFGFSGMEFDTLARHGVNVVAVVGNNGIWALEKHPMEALYGYSVIADLRPATRYDTVCEALGCHGELVERPEQLRPALERAFSAGAPALVNVLTDPAVAYPRRSNLA